MKYHTLEITRPMDLFIYNHTIMKTQKDYSWLLVAIVLGLALLGSMGCKSAHPVSHGDSTECAVFEGYPLILIFIGFAAS